MAPSFTKWILVIIVSVSMRPEILVQGQQQVPCLFIFGDSQFDNGNNNALITKAKVNYLPYGIDYPDGPTGRFTNGRNIADYLAQFLGFANASPPFATARGSDLLRGVNYASGAAGILDESGMQLGDRISLNRQLLNHQFITIPRIRLLLLNNRTTTVEDYVNKCLYVVNMGSNDYLNNYLLPNSLSSLLYTPDQFAAILIQRLSQQLRTLYNSGARKVAVYGIGLLGCVPQELAMFPSNVSASGCVDFINGYVQLYNNRMKPLIDDLNSNLADAQFTYINTTSLSSGDPSSIGIRVVNASCCPVEVSTGQCVRGGVPCSNRNEYAFWDNFHPTDLPNQVSASRSYTVLLPSDAYPLDIQRLVQQ